MRRLCCRPAELLALASLFLIRHPETALNKGAAGKDDSAERIRGWTEVPLNEKGKREAVKLGARFANSGATKIYSSDLGRAQTAALSIAKGLQSAGHRVPLIKTDQLRPWNLGVLTGKEVRKVIPVMNKCVEDSWVKIPDGESFDDFTFRYLPFLKELLTEAAKSQGPILAVTHSRNLQLARAWDKKGRPKDCSFDVERMLDYRDEVEPGKFLELKSEDSGGR